jgi:hypothetical protein
MLNGLKKWWRGVPPQVTDIEGGGWSITYQDPAHPPARERIRRQIDTPWVKKGVWWVWSIMGLVIAGVITAAIAKWLGFV